VRAPVHDTVPLALLLVLHGAGGHPTQALALVEDLPEAADLLVLAPQSRRVTWDVIGGEWGEDVAFISRAMQAVAAGRAIDPARMAISGFSDGASYALSLGLANGELFRAILAWSPGFAAPPRRVGWPRVFISHGTRDQVLPIARCSRWITQRLEAAGYELCYREFDGGHTVPPALAAEALSWGFAAVASSR